MSRELRFVWAAALALSLCSAGCKIPQRPLEGAVEAFNQATRDVVDQSKDWQTTLKDLADKLRTEGVPDAAREVDLLRERAVQGLGVEAKCFSDYAAKGLELRLTRLKNQMLNRPTPPPNPVLCSSSPGEVQLSALIGQKNHVRFSGFDLDPNDRSGMLKVVLENETTRSDITADLTVSSNYTATLDLSKLLSPGSPLGHSSKRILLMWGSDVLFAVPVIKSQLPAVRTVPIPAKRLDAMRVFGDADLGTKSPIKVKFAARLHVHRSKIDLKVSFAAEEVGRDRTTFKATDTFTIFTTDDASERIVRVTSPLDDEYAVELANKASDQWTYTSTKLFRRADAQINRKGADSPSVQMEFMPVVVEVQRLR